MKRNKFDVDEDLEIKFSLVHLKRLLKYITVYKTKFLITISIMILAAFVNLLGPYLIKDALDVKIPGKDLKGLIFISIVYLLTLVINNICMKYKIRIMTFVGQNAILNMRKDLFVHLQKLPFQYYDSRPHGKILVRAVNYVNGLSDLLSNGIVNMITDLFTLIFIIMFMLYINIKLTVTCLIGIPVIILVMFLLKNIQRKAWQLLSNKLSNLNAYTHESICGMRVTQCFTREDENLSIFRKLNDDYRKHWIKSVKIQFLMSPVVDNISVIIIAAVYIIGIASIDKDVTIGVLIAFIGYIGRFWTPISNLAGAYNNIINAMSYIERIFETIDEKVIVEDMSNAYELPVIRGNVEFKNVTFAYDESKTILNNISFSVSHGQSIALVGPTGAGKSSIINLISRFYDIQQGEILIDGINIKEVTLNSLRRQMGVMLQDPFIFSGTIKENIRYGRLDDSDEEIVAAAKSVRAHDFIKELKDGYETIVNENGSRFSAGQKQLISFARALLADPKILILDEATSSIDTKTEALLQEGLQKLLKGRTSFIIAHRLSTIKNSDKIMYIDKGQIIESGNHDELINKQGEYYKLYSSQYELFKAI
ncbi:ABC transporter ATP-binding protein [Clostridium pasteurianum]|uniref:ABC-type multidrug transport system, ATPase and permease component n=1 Tax=Clostridium pasteurianum BC1 TaxID=86416 RepID=R4K669_CLOPA|nr:ABC transporter ATP-binding protein [Clostridium pasteurianum]AGK98687.1 ABC-type multidrug transport system, ATPase and permease component [Clostridium pasteurianum BC1]